VTVERISDLQAFVAVVEQGGVSAAARHLRRSIQSVSRSLAAVERAVGVELVRRTTRSSQATKAGVDLYRRVSSALREIEDASADAAGARDRAVGILRISASTRFAPEFVVPAIASFLAEQPEVEVELNLHDGYADLIRESYDVAVRIGPMPDSSLKAKRLASLRRVTFAAPGYIAEHGEPRHPHELVDHACILRTASRDGASWPFTIEGRSDDVRVSGTFRTNSADAANRAALFGLGIANAPYWQVRDLVESGGLQLVLTEFEPPDTEVHALWPQSAQVPAKTRLFVEHLAAHLKAQRL